MCGIAGVFGRPDTETVQKMLTTMLHRGPDDGFVVGGDDFAIGARRLSIVDPEGGRQPLSNEKGTVWAVQNGELYNYPEVRPILLKRGHVLRTSSDTEMIPHLYEDHGTDFVQHVDGMFAIAVWDDQKKLGIIARDRMGKKPLYYHFDRQAHVLYFGSELKTLLQIPNFEKRINYDALNHYVSLKHVPHPMTIFQNCYILAPSHYLIFRKGSEPETRRYWDFSFETLPELANITEEEAIDEILRLLRQGIKRRFMSDVPIGFFLSGGIDSSLSTALAAELSGERIRTFTLTYSQDSTTPGKEMDRHWASWVARRYDTEHHEELVTFRSYPDTIQSILRHFDEPFAGVVSTYFLSELISKHVKVALSGDAADELFGSYLSHRLAFPLSRFDEFKRTGNASLIHPFENEAAYLETLNEPEAWMWRYKLLVLSDAEKNELFTSDARQQIHSSTRDWVQNSFSELTATDPLNRILEMEWRTIFPDQVLTFVDRLSMAHSLEIRTGYLDRDLVTFVAQLPGKLKICNGETKYLLKKAAARYFPKEMVFRKKEGFLLPITQWIFNDLETYVRDTLSPARLGKHGIFEYAEVHRLIDAMYQDGQDYRLVNKVMVILLFQEWADLFL